MPDPRAFLGTGFRFPLAVGPTGGLGWASGEEDIREAIWIVLATARRERAMRPRFGCGIHDYVFAPTDATTRGDVAHQVRAALTEWEPRIDVLSVDVDAAGDDANRLEIRVEYRVRSNNTFHNLVYPFYVQEGVRA